MTSQRNDEQRFSEELDRVLAGRESPSEDKPADIRFARRMMDLRTNPSDNFRAGLRERLLLEMVRREVAEGQRRSWWGKIRYALGHDVVARTAGVVVLVAAVALLFGGMWQMGVFAGREGTVVTQPPPTRPIVGSTGPNARTIEVNQSVTANGYAVYLSQIVIAATTTEVYAVSPSGLATGPTPPSVSAEYYFDEATPASAGPATSERLAISSTAHIWTIPSPPEGARQLTFSIISVGVTQGPWTFVIPLDR